MTLKVKVNDSFSIPAEGIPRWIFGANLVILAQINYKLSCGQAKFSRILSQNVQNDLEDQGLWPLFSLPAESNPGCMFGATLVILAQICDELSCGQAEFPRILSQNGQNDLEGQGQWSYFQYQSRVSLDACLMQIWWFQLKSVTSYCLDKVKFTDRRTDGRSDNTPFGLKGQGVKMNHDILVILFCFMSRWCPCNMVCILYVDVPVYQDLRKAKRNYAFF